MEYAEQFQKLEELLKAHNPDVDLTMLEKAFALAPDDARLQENCALLRAKIQKESRI